MTLSIAFLLIGALAGAMMGALYLGLLWVAVQRLPQERGGTLVFVGLALARVALLIATMAAAIALGVPAEGLLAGLAGFITVRVATTRLIRRRTPGDTAWK